MMYSILTFVPNFKGPPYFNELSLIEHTNVKHIKMRALCFFDNTVIKSYYRASNYRVSNTHYINSSFSWVKIRSDMKKILSQRHAALVVPALIMKP